MATYEFRCPDCSVFDVVVPMTAVRPTHPCPACGADAARVYSAPALATTSPGMHRAMTAAEASAEQPQVVRSIPDGAPRPRSRRWNPMTGAAPISADRRPAGPHPALPRW